MELLEMKRITKAFPGVLANDHIDLCVHAGEVHALLGENGAGKTTLMNILYGLYRADSGEIYWKGEKASFETPLDALRAGIGMVHQHFTLVPTMSVLQNIILGLRAPGYPFIKTAEIEEKIKALGERYGLAVEPKKKISELSVGEQQRVEILKALYREAELLILDEPTAVLTPGETRDFFAILKRLKQEGHAVILITHRMSEIMAVSDRVTVLRDGKTVATLETAQTDETTLAQKMIGRELPERTRLEKHEACEKAMLELKDVALVKEKITKLELSLCVLKGEILGVAGVDGNGQKELAELICGIAPPSRGELYFEGKSLSHSGVRERFEKGISYISDDRQHDGLVLDMNVRQNLMLRAYKKAPFVKNGMLERGKIKDYADACVCEYQIKTPSLETPMRLLSGGNQQKAILAREISEQASLIVACQPTRGLDIGATTQVRSTLAKARNRGASVLLISADLEELLALCDRIAVLFRGRIMGIVPNDPALKLETLGAMMGGHPLEESEADNG